MNKQPETQSVSVEENAVAYSPTVNIIRPILANHLNEWSSKMLMELADALHTHSLATEEVKEEAAWIVESMMEGDENWKPIVDRIRGITLSDSK